MLAMPFLTIFMLFSGFFIPASQVGPRTLVGKSSCAERCGCHGRLAAAAAAAVGRLSPQTEVVSVATADPNSCFPPQVPTMWKWVPDVNFLYYTVNYAVVDEINQMSYCSMPGTANMMVNGTEVIAEADCRELLIEAGFDPDITFLTVMISHIATNVVTRLLAYFGLR